MISEATLVEISRSENESITVTNLHHVVIAERVDEEWCLAMVASYLGDKLPSGLPRISLSLEDSVKNKPYQLVFFLYFSHLLHDLYVAGSHLCRHIIYVQKGTGPRQSPFDDHLFDSHLVPVVGNKMNTHTKERACLPLYASPWYLVL